MTTDTQTKTLTRQDVCDAVLAFRDVVAEWEQSPEPVTQWRGSESKVVSQEVSEAAASLFDMLQTADVERSAWELVLAVDRFEDAITNWAERIQRDPFHTDPQGGREVWGPWEEVLRVMDNPRRRRQPTPIRVHLAEGVRHRQIAKDYGWYKEDGSPDEQKVLEELASPGAHYKPDEYCHPKDAAWEKELAERWEHRCQDLAGESAYTAAVRAEPKKEWQPPPETIEELLLQNVPLVQIAKMHRVDLDGVRRVAAEIGCFTDPSVAKFARDQQTPTAIKTREELELLKINAHPECGDDVESRVLAISEDGHMPGVVAKVLQRNGFPEMTHQRVTKILKGLASAES